LKTPSTSASRSASGNGERRRAFLAKAVARHGDRYDYSSVVYVDNSTKVTIICRAHGPFQQSPVKHVRGQNCPACAGNKKLCVADFVARAVGVHGVFYDYSKVIYRGIDVKVTIVCPIHDAFEQTPYEHLRGHGCCRCGNGTLTRDKFIELANTKYSNKYNYDKVIYVTHKTPVLIVCPVHGDFRQTPAKHLRLDSRGCWACVRDSCRHTTTVFVAKAVAIHGHYDYSDADYSHAFASVAIICPVHGEFRQRANDHLNGHGCPRCQTMVSLAHAEIVDFIQSKNVTVIVNDRVTIAPYEIDVWVPDYKFGVDYHGYYWHGVNSRTLYNRRRLRWKHSLKADAAVMNKVGLFQIFDYEYNRNQSLVRSMIAHRLGLSERLSARDCEVNIGPVGDFYTHNHLYGHRDGINIALLFAGKIVAAIGFARHHLADYEVTRFCCRQGVTVVGGFSRLLTAFRRLHPGTSILSYSDRRFSTGGIYRSAGFTCVRTTKPNYRYVKHKLVLSRNACQKAKLTKVLGAEFDPSLSEVENMMKAGFTMVFDAGHSMWVLT
jgi:hypothetical protein